MSKTPTIKYNIICGDGLHRMFTACLAEIMLLNKYGNQHDFFWQDKQYYDEYVTLIKLAGKLSKEVGRDKLAYFLYKNPTYRFEGDVGLLIFNLRKFKAQTEFTLQELVQIYKNKYRPTENKAEIVEKTIEPPKKNVTLRDFLGDI